MSFLADFDFSQVEFVAPFLQRFGGKVFLYKWHSVKQKMTDYYADKSQYPNVAVEEFSLTNIVRHVLAEEKQVVFLMTASTAYHFGQYQYQLLLKLKQSMPDRIAGVSTARLPLPMETRRSNIFFVPIYRLN